MFNLHTKSLIVQHYVISIPIPPSIIDLVNDMGKADGMTHIEFQTEHKKLIWDSSLIAGVDYEPYNEEDVAEEDDEDDNEDDDYDPNQDQDQVDVPLTHDTDEEDEDEDEDEGIPVNDTPSMASESESDDEDM